MKTISQTLFFVGIALALIGGVFIAASWDVSTANAWDGGGHGGGCDCGGDGPGGGGNGGGNDGGRDGGGNDNYVAPKKSAPVCNYLRANGKTGSITLPAGGGKVNFSWSASNAGAIALQPTNINVGPIGFHKEHVTKDTTYTLQVVSYTGSDSCEVDVNVADPVTGCTDIFATNYDPEADEDDGSCEYPEPDVTSCKLYTSAETIEFGTSVTLNWETEGFDVIKLNGQVVSNPNDSKTFENVTVNTTYTLEATNDNGDSCTTSVTVTCLPQVILGCTDEDALNYNPDATESDNSCEYPEEKIKGCTDVNATNYNPEAEVDDHSCTYPETPTPMAPVCPLVEKDGRIIVDFAGQKLRTDRGEERSRTEIKAIDLAAGEYDVTLVSWDGYKNRVTTSQPNEQWKLHFLNGDSIIAASGYSTDLADNVIEDTKIDKVNTALVIPSAVTALRGVQPYFPNKQFANSLYPICAAIDNVTPDVEVPAPTCEFYPTEGVIEKGESTELNWTTTNAVRVVLSGGTGEVALNGSSPVAPLADLMYKLTAFNSEGTAVDCDTKIIVTDPEEPEVLGCTDVDATNYDADATKDDGSCEYPEVPVPGCTDEDATNYDADATEDDGSCEYRTTTGGGGGSSSPRCELEVSDASIEAGDKVTLTWETSRATEVTITDDRGNVVVTTDEMLSDDKRDLYDGEITVTPSRDTEYTLVAERGRRDRECSVEVEVESDDIVVLETRDQAPLVAGISLSEVPYTGFEAGPFMTFVFYTLLIGWALYLTYVLVIPKNVFATVAPTTEVKEKTSVDHMQSAEALRPDVFTPMTPATPVVASTAAVAPAPVNLPVAPVAPVAAPAATPTMAAVTDAKTPVEVAALEAIAHNNQALLSSDAIKTFVNNVPATEQLTKIVEVVNNAKAQFPLEDGWVVVNNDRMTALLVA